MAELRKHNRLQQNLWEDLLQATVYVTAGPSERKTNITGSPAPEKKALHYR